MTRAYNTATTQQNSGGAVAGVTAGKNAIINGGFDIWQRGTSVTGSGAYVYNTDRWQGFLASTYTVSRIDVSSLLNNFQYGLRAQRASGQTTTNYFNIEQGLETATIQPLRGNIVTVSFWARCGANFSPTSSQMGVTLFCGTGTERVRNVTAFTSETTPINANATLTTTYQKFTFTSTAIPTTTTQAALTFSAYPIGTAGANDWFEVTGVQVEVGSVATPFSRAAGTIQGELAACQRYFANVVPSTADYGTVISMFQAASGSTAKGGIRFPVPMRTSASITLANANNFTLANASYTPIGGSSFTYAIGNTVDCRIDMSVASGLTAGNATALSGNTANLLIQASAEL
jgi:hypothetical protein